MKPTLAVYSCLVLRESAALAVGVREERKEVDRSA
jgi:hypothetical protein